MDKVHKEALNPRDLMRKFPTGLPAYARLAHGASAHQLAACRILEINPNMGLRWLHGGKGMEGLPVPEFNSALARMRKGKAMRSPSSGRVSGDAPLGVNSTSGSTITAVPPSTVRMMPGAMRIHGSLIRHRNRCNRQRQGCMRDVQGFGREVRRR